MDKEILAKKLEHKKQIVRLKAQENLLSFIVHTKQDYREQWFHKIICSYLDKLFIGEIKKLMIFVPPQHGKSEISSRRFPAYVLGKHPKTKIAVCSYSPDLAGQFNRSIQDILDDDRYKEIFPKTKLLSTGIPMHERGNEIRNTNMFETLKYKGFVKTVGIGSALTGTPVDIGIIDDPFKDRETANSELNREKVWNWYNDVFKTRLHNDSKLLLLFTRWHEDDLAGRILDRNNPHYDEEEASEWTVIALPALKEAEDNEFNTVQLNDKREIDEALWEEMHSAKKYIQRRRISPTSFASLDQQRPKVVGGNKILSSWFEIIPFSALPYNPESFTVNFYLDGAFTDKTVNDQTAILSCCFFRGKLYIYNCIAIRKELYQFLEFFPSYFRSNHGSSLSKLHIELMASGYPIMSMLGSDTYGNYNCIGIPSKTVSLGKMNRVENAEPFLASGKVVLVKGGWNEAFLNECTSFPNGTHDDMVDVLCYAVSEWFIHGIQEYGTDATKEELGFY